MIIVELRCKNIVYIRMHLTSALTQSIIQMAMLQFPETLVSIIIDILNHRFFFLFFLFFLFFFFFFFCFFFFVLFFFSMKVEMNK